MVRRLAPPQMVECLLEARRRLGSTEASRPTSRYMYSCLNSQGWRLGGNDISRRLTGIYRRAVVTSIQIPQV